MSTDEQIIKMLYIYKIKYFSSIKNKIMKVADKCMEPEKNIMSEITQIQKHKYYMLSFIYVC